MATTVPRFAVICQQKLEGRIVKMQFAKWVWDDLVGAGRSYAEIEQWLAENSEFEIKKSSFNNLSLEGASLDTFLEGCRLAKALMGAGWNHTYAELCRTEEQREFLRARFEYADLPVRIERIDQQFERDLKRYCEVQVRLWQDMLDGKNPRHDYTRYEPPRFSRILDRSAQPERKEWFQSKAPSDREFLSPAFADEDEKFTPLFQLGSRVLVHDDAGGGKTTFSRAVVAWLSRPSTWNRQDFLHGKPCLAVRFEPIFAPWPACMPGESARGAYLREIRSRLVEALGCSEERARDIAHYAWMRERIVLVMDAFDQVSIRDQRQAFEQLTNSDPVSLNTKDARVLTTSRPHSALIDPHFSTNLWYRVQLEGFTHWQQLVIIRDEVGNALGACWRADFKGLREAVRAKDTTGAKLDAFAKRALEHSSIFGGLYRHVEELLRVPIVLQFVRDMCQESENGAFPQFVNRADLYWQATEQLLRRNLKSDSNYKGTSTAKIDSAMERFRHALSAIAVHMMFDDAANYSTSKAISIRYAARSSMRGVALADEEWTELLGDLERLAGLTNHNLIEEATDHRLAWKHRGMMEFYCGLFLARYAALPEQDRLPLHATNPEWFWAFRFAMELTQVKDAEHLTYELPTLERMMATLFGPVTQTDPKRVDHKQPRPQYHCGRPTQLMYYATCLLDGELEPHQREPPVARPLPPSDNTILRDFRQTFRDLVEAPIPNPIALQLTLGHRYQLRGGNKPFVDSFVLCPPSGRPDDPVCTYLMGEGHTAGLVRVRPFWMASTPVTVQQFALFAPLHRGVTRERSYHFHLQMSPVVDVSWYDAFMFAHWVGDGCRLPSEAEWEFACRARTRDDAPYTNYSFGNSCNGTECNTDGNYPYPSIMRWLDRLDWPPYAESTTLPGRYPPSDYQLWDMHGNVLEWCDEWYDHRSRALRGGCWYFKARDCRSAVRYGGTPSNHDDYSGFRIARTRSSVPS